jgi:hypothetical protein
MEPEPGRLRDVTTANREDAPFESFTDEEIDALETLAEFEAEHRRILALQTLFYKRRKAGGAA